MSASSRVYRLISLFLANVLYPVVCLTALGLISCLGLKGRSLGLMLEEVVRDGVKVSHFTTL